MRQASKLAQSWRQETQHRKEKSGRMLKGVGSWLRTGEPKAGTLELGFVSSISWNVTGITNILGTGERGELRWEQTKKPMRNSKESIIGAHQVSKNTKTGAITEQ